MAESAACFGRNMGKAIPQVKSGRPGAGFRTTNFGRREAAFYTHIQLIVVIKINTIIMITTLVQLCMNTRGGCIKIRYNPAVHKYMPDPTEPGENSGRSAVAGYVATLSADLAAMARKTGLETLGYLLEMVRLEAESVTRHTRPNGRR